MFFKQSLLYMLLSSNYYVQVSIAANIRKTKCLRCEYITLTYWLRAFKSIPNLKFKTLARDWPVSLQQTKSFRSTFFSSFM